MRKYLAITIIVGFLGLVCATAVLAVGDILTTSMRTWTNPPGDYVYDVTTNSLTDPETLCLQYRTDKGSGWQWYYEDLCTGGPTDWVCTIPGPLTAGYNYQWYIDGDGNCTDTAGGDGNDRDWTPSNPGWQPTGPNAVTLSSFTADAAAPALLVGGVLLLGAVILWRRKRA